MYYRPVTASVVPLKQWSQPGAAEDQPGRLIPPILRTMGQAYVSDPLNILDGIQFRRSILVDFINNRPNYQSVKKNLVVSSHTHFAIIHRLIIHANFSRISAENCVAEYQNKNIRLGQYQPKK